MSAVGKLYSRGFTIVELLIVIVIIGILASLVIIAYGGIQNRAHDTSVQNDMQTFAKKVELVNADTGTYPDMTTEALSELSYKVSKQAYGMAGNGQYGPGYNIGYCVNPSTKRWVLYSIAASGNAFRVGSGISLQQIEPLAGGGWSVCQIVGVSSTNPVWGRSANNDTWSSWLN